MVPCHDNVFHAGFGRKDARPTCADDYVLPTVIKHIRKIAQGMGRPLKILDIGCGNGYAASKMAELGHSVWAVDVSPDGIDIGRTAYPMVQFEICSFYDDRMADLVPGLVDCVVSIEVVEHLFSRESYFSRAIGFYR